MSALAAAHNRLVDYALIAELRGNGEAARSLRFSARLLAMLMNAEIAAKRAAQAGEAGTAETVKQGSVHEHAVSRSEMRPNPPRMTIQEA